MFPPTYDYVLSGQLTLKLDAYGTRHSSWSDGSSRLEELLGHAVLGIEDVLALRARHAAEAAARKRAEEEAQRRRAEAAARASYTSALEEDLRLVVFRFSARITTCLPTLTVRLPWAIPSLM